MKCLNDETFQTSSSSYIVCVLGNREEMNITVIKMITPDAIMKLKNHKNKVLN
jgi:hypothetical protein